MLDTIEELPKSWVSVRLGDFVESEKGKKPANEKNKKDNRFCYPYIDIEAFEQHIIKSYADGENCRLCSENDFLMVWDGSRSGLVGKGMNGALGSTLIRINFPHIFNDYAFYFLQSKYLQINTRAKGSGTPHVDPDLLWNYRFTIPPYNEQKRIVSKIEELFSELDKGIESLKTARDQLNVYRQSLLKHAFEGKLTEQWRKENTDKLETSKELLEDIKLKSETHYDLPTLPHGWVWTKFINLIEYVTSGSRGWAKYYAESGAMFIRAQNIKYDRLDIDDIAYVELPKNVEGKRTLIKKSDLLITITGANVTKTAYVKNDINEAYVSQHVALCRLIDVRLANYLYMFLIAGVAGRKQLEKAAYGAGKPGLNLDNIKELIVPITSIDECSIVADLLECNHSIIEQFENEINEHIKKCIALRQSILKKGFSGQLVSQDPADEPAVELLKRIKEEKEKIEAVTKASKTTKRKTKKKNKKRAAKV